MAAPRFCQLSSQSCWTGPVLFLLHHCLDKTSFLCSPVLPLLHIVYPPQKERQDSSRQVSPVPLDTSTLYIDQEKNFRQGKTPSGFMIITVTSSFLQGVLRLEMKQQRVTWQSSPTTQPKGRLTTPLCPTCPHGEQRVSLTKAQMVIKPLVEGDTLQRSLIHKTRQNRGNPGKGNIFQKVLKLIAPHLPGFPSVKSPLALAVSRPHESYPC